MTSNGRRGAAARRAFAPGIAVALVGLLAASGCATHSISARHFEPARAEEVERALEAWSRAVARADSMPPSRLLYDARIQQGIGSLSGTLAVSTGSPMHATLTGPFGSPLATYEDGALRGEKLAPIVIEPEHLVWLLAGVWKAASPSVRGFEGTDALLVWEVSPRVEGVLDVATSRFTSLEVSRGRAAYSARYAGDPAPWPAEVDLREVSTSNRMVLTLQAHEPIP